MPRGEGTQSCEGGKRGFEGEVTRQCTDMQTWSCCGVDDDQQGLLPDEASLRDDPRASARDRHHHARLGMVHACHCRHDMLCSSLGSMHHAVPEAVSAAHLSTPDCEGENVTWLKLPGMCCFRIMVCKGR